MTTTERPPLMGCGHAANGTYMDPNIGPVACCISCSGIHPNARMEIPYPDLTGRVARCGDHGEVPSDPKQCAFWESGLIRALGSCRVCGYGVIAHAPEVRNKPHNRKTKLGDGHAFEHKDDPGHDHYYCGCRGWD